MKLYIDMDATLVDFATQVTKLHAILFSGTLERNVAENYDDFLLKERKWRR